MRAHKFLSTKYWSVVALPSLTSCVHCSSGSLMPKALSMAKAMSRKSRLSIPRSLIAWLSGVIESRGISQVSAIILAMVSNVEDIGNSLIIGKNRTTPRRAARTPLRASQDERPDPRGPASRSAARIAKQTPRFNGEVPAAGDRSLPASGRRRLDLRAAHPAGEHAILVTAHRCNRVGEPQRDSDHSHDDDEHGAVYQHAPAIFLRRFRRVSVIGQLGRLWRMRRLLRKPQHAVLSAGLGLAHHLRHSERGSNPSG